MHVIIGVLALIITILYLLFESYMKERDSISSRKPSKTSVEKRQYNIKKEVKQEVKQDSSKKAEQKNKTINVIRKKGKTVFYENSRDGELALHDDGKITVNMDYKPLLDGLEYRRYGSYFSIANPTQTDKQVIMDRLFN